MKFFLRALQSFATSMLDWGGGVLVAVRKSIWLWLVPTPADLEVVTLRIQLQHVVILSCVYAPHLAAWRTWSSSAHIFPCGTALSCGFVGDFNLSHIDWSTLQGSCPFHQAFCDMVFDYNLSQLVNQPIPIFQTTEPATIDQLGVHSASDCFLGTNNFMLKFGLLGEFTM